MCKLIRPEFPTPCPSVVTQTPPEARAAKIQGTVVMSIMINDDGTVSDVKVVRPLGYGLDEQALSTVQTWRFQPATRNGAPVPVRVVVQVEFRLFK